MSKSYNYAIITPARNEEKYIEKTITSVIKQTILPEMWLIVNDGSTDDTDIIAKKYAKKYNFIKVLNVNGDKIRNFGSKAKAFTFGYNQIADLKNEYICNLDADIMIENDYFENILMKFHLNKKLGIAGGVIYEKHKEKFVKVSLSCEWSVSGAVQCFRRKCYEDIGGYVSTQSGIDAIAEIMARMHGWEVRTFPEFRVWHNRSIGATNQNILSAKFKLGMQDYSIGYIPMFEVLRCIYRFTDKPYIAGSVFILIGYLWSYFKHKNIVVPQHVKDYIKNEQMNRLKRYVLLNNIKKCFLRNNIIN